MGVDVAAEGGALAGLEPAGLWRHFEALTRIARPSLHEERAVEHVGAWAAARGLESQTDAGGNVVVRVPASAGRERAPAVALQGHLDMVCERRPDSPYDPAAGRIALVRRGDWLTADGTTLGADNGVAIAAMMALVEDASVSHGPLELLMTVTEEVGVEGRGANALDPSLVRGRTLLNLDSEEDGKLTVGSAGSTDSSIAVRAPRTACQAGAAALAVTVAGGLGGHSGVDIARGHANAIKLLAQVLGEAFAAAPFRLASLEGGGSWNAIPRGAAATCALAAEREDAFRAAVAAAAATVRDAYAKTDPGVSVSVTGSAAPADAWTPDATATLLDLARVVPSGPLAMSPDFPGVVEASTSLGEATTDRDRLALHSLSRTAGASELPAILATLGAAARLAGGRLDVAQSDPAWTPHLDSPALAGCAGVYERLFGAPPVVTVVHAWLETAVIGARVPALDMVSLGPQIEAPHSPDERVSIPTVERFWRLLCGTVDALSSGPETRSSRSDEMPRQRDR